MLVMIVLWLAEYHVSWHDHHVEEAKVVTKGELVYINYEWLLIEDCGLSVIWGIPEFNTSSPQLSCMLKEDSHHDRLANHKPCLPSSAYSLVTHTRLTNQL